MARRAENFSEIRMGCLCAAKKSLIFQKLALYPTPTPPVARDTGVGAPPAPTATNAEIGSLTELVYIHK